MKRVSKKVNFNSTYESMWPQVYNYIYYKVQNAEEAEELTQDVFHKVYKQLEKSNIDEDKIKAYIFTSARNLVYDVWRKNKRRPKVIMLDDMRDKGLEIGKEDASAEDNLIVEEALKKLSPVEGEVLRLRILEGYQIKEVSEMLDKPVGTIKSLQFRALKKLRDILVEGGYFDE
jgi:RNA polymerase sigma-70 factor (ECF subfamily)